MFNDGMDENEESGTELDALAYAAELDDVLGEPNFMDQGLPNFFKGMAEYQQESFSFLEIQGVGVLTHAFVWWLGDRSTLVLGMGQNENLLTVVLPPGSEFKPLPYSDGLVQLIH